jgi:hypothetical protein
MSFGDFRRRADRVRDIPLETVLRFRGAKRDRRDKAKWHTEQGPLSVSEPKFTNWQQGHGGGGAIDLVMHLAGVGFRTAVEWLEQQMAAGHFIAGEATTNGSSGRCSAMPADTRQLRLPAPDKRMLARVCHYLTARRHLVPALLEPLLKSGRLYADSRGNAVFLLVAGKGNRPVGAELRGTGPRIWRGMAPGTRKNLGYFWIGAQGSRQLVLCESAIDAISCYQMHSQYICLSTAGVRANPGWLRGLIHRGYDIYCGFDTDDSGDRCADRMIAIYPAIGRLRPPAHDWNDALVSRS